MDYKDILTVREIKVLQLIVEGLTNNEIADKLGLSAHTIKAHVSSIFEKMGAHSRVVVAVKAVKSNIIQNDKIYYF